MKVLQLALLIGLLLIAQAHDGLAQSPSGDRQFSGLEVKIGGGGGDGLSVPLRILVLLTLLSLVPALLLSVTSFTRIIIVTHFLRQALGTQTMPPNQVLIGLALFLTFFIMQPVGSRIHQEAVQPMLRGEMTEMQALETAGGPLRDFMLRY
ncbi:MAG: flagellar biosynthetic protein FliP, partial [Acidobacteria bacterium]|nr:flagellar biosynthetic protein FliP [Acidobacteriota bacterium]